MKRNRCSKCGSDKNLKKHFILPVEKFGVDKNQSDELCEECYKDFHATYPDYLNAKDKSPMNYVIHYFMWLINTIIIITRMLK